MNPHRKEVEKLLYNFGQKGLKPSDEFIHEGKRLGQQVFVKLEKESKNFTIAETRIAGSVGKKTSVIHPDLDLVVVINKCLPPFDEILDKLELILELHKDELEIRHHSIHRKTDFSIQFEFECGIQVDLLPAAHKTHEDVHKLIAANPKDYYKYGSSLVKRQLDFMTSHQSSFVHIVIRLAKFWFKSLCFGDKYVSGGCTIIELIGIAAAEKEERACGKNAHCSTLRAFTDVISTISNLRGLKWAFGETGQGSKWEQVPQNQISSTSLVPKVIGTMEILKRSCFIVEPANPFNDMLAGNSSIVIDKLIGFAKETKQRIDKLLNNSEIFTTRDSSIITEIVKLFEPQPTSLMDAFSEGAAPNRFVINFHQPWESSYSDMIVRTPELLELKEVKLMVEAVKWQLIAVVNSVIKLDHADKDNNRPDTGTEIIFMRVREAVSDQLRKSLNFEVNAENKPHKEMDITLIVPYEVGGSTYSVIFSMLWGQQEENNSFLVHENSCCIIS